MIQVHNAAQAWVELSKYILKKGIDYGDIIECLSTNVVIDNIQPKDKQFDNKFRAIFGDERIDYAKSVTFVEPTKGLFEDEFIYNPIKPSWKDTYFGRMISFRNEFNQLENAIKILKKKEKTKRCELIIYDPITDARNLYKQPCLLAIDIKPRHEGLYLHAFFRSQAVSKSGYADCTALLELGQWLAKVTDYKFHSLIMTITSAHIRKQNKEKHNTITLLKELNEYSSN